MLVTFTTELELPVKNAVDENDGTEHVDVIVTAEVDMDDDVELNDAVTFIEPTEMQLKALYGHERLHLFIEDADAAAQRKQLHEKQQAEFLRDMAGIASGFGGGL